MFAIRPRRPASAGTASLPGLRAAPCRARWRARVSGRAGTLLAALAMSIALPAQAACTAPDWPKWTSFVQHFVQYDGRVIDASTPQRHSSSEGQSYAMFFALVADDRATFDLLWRWTVANLAAGDIHANLPAWFWGLHEDGSWGVLDRNSAADADLWFTYALLEAGRLWDRPDYVRDAQALLAQVEAREVASLPGFGKMLLPAPAGFAQPGALWRLNPSYLPIPLLRRLAQASPAGPWIQVAANTVRMIQATAPKGYAADWTAYQGTAAAAGHFVIDPIKGAKGSYDAIRTYMWAGMTPASDPASGPLLAALAGLAGATAAAGAPPESVQVDSGAVNGTGPFGFSAALLPYLQVTGRTAPLESQLGRVHTLWDASLSPDSVAQRQPPYYDYVLSLFGTAWLEQRYRFGDAGRVHLQWEKTCP